MGGVQDGDKKETTDSKSTFIGSEGTSLTMADLPLAGALVR